MNNLLVSFWSTVVGTLNTLSFSNSTPFFLIKVIINNKTTELMMNNLLTSSQMKNANDKRNRKKIEFDLMSEVLRHTLFCCLFSSHSLQLSLSPSLFCFFDFLIFCRQLLSAARLFCRFGAAISLNK